MKIKELADTIVRKFVETFSARKWDIMTDTGWQQVNNVSKTIPYDVWKIVTQTGKFLECADDHIVFLADGQQIFAKDTLGKQIRTADGPELVVACSRERDAEHMYDLEVNSDDHRFYSNGILSHNSITTCAFLLWTILFKEQQNIAILANKYKTAQKLLSDLKKSYMGIPKWMQQGVVEWNKGNIELENGCKIMASSTASDAIRGNAFNLIFLDEFAFVPAHIAEDFFKSVYPTISSGETTKVIIVSTPNGMNMFHAMWTQANNPRNSPDPQIKWNGYESFAIHWSMVPKPDGSGPRDIVWKQKTISLTSESQFRQEFESIFGDVYIEVKDRETNLSSSIQIQELYEQFKHFNEAAANTTIPDGTTQS